MLFNSVIGCLIPFIGLISGSRVCNITIEALVGAEKQVMNPILEDETYGTELTCWYHIRTKPSILDLSISLDFERFSVGNLAGNSCVDGHLQVLDSKHSRVNEDLGVYCGNINQPKLIIRETDIIKLIFFSHNASKTLEWSFTVRAIGRKDLPQRFGSHPEYFPGRVGAVVEGTYCETVFQDCREQSCFVQSPGFPGVYPRGISCRYYISTKSALIRMYIDGVFWDAFNVDSRRCENFIECDIRQLGADCPYDYVSIYDGMDEYSPLIGKFCGTGYFPQSIVGTTNRLFIEFVTSRAGPLMNTGFDFKITSSPSTGLPLINSSYLEIQSIQLNGKDEGTILSLEHWYKPGTNCSTLLKGTSTQVVRLYFEKMKIVEKDSIQSKNGSCEEYLALYDASWPDPTRVLKVFCDGVPQSNKKKNYISTGPTMFVNFVSHLGSYSGSSIYYWGVFDFHDTETNGEKVLNSRCDEDFTSNSGTIRSPINSLLFLNPRTDVKCKYRIRGNPTQYRRISLLLEYTKFPSTSKTCHSCTDKNVDHLEVLGEGDVSSFCYSSCSNLNQSLEIISASSSLSLLLFISKATSTGNYFKKKPAIFQAHFSFLHHAVCGPTVIKADQSGFIKFPDVTKQRFPDENVYCIWDLVTVPLRNIQFQFGNLTFISESCQKHSILLSSLKHDDYHKECGQSRGSSKTVNIPGSENGGTVKLTLKMKSLDLGQFQLRWNY
ncbi:cubilin [Eurytemora carolleeae]|uniref:cubilin n=1 Tax=Eurytemora carolleeae TaxID=1294199 RepID=UPI000C780F16|nr:cubilin [Eurytemora carolleeae]|eukprot:XP_023332424.1 cubilin-like [Eurytemora affinis]